MSVAEVTSFLASVTPPLTTEQKAQLQYPYSQAVLADCGGAIEISDSVQTALRAQPEQPDLKASKKNGSTATIRGIASFLDKQLHDFEQWTTLKHFMSLRKDPTVRPALDENDERFKAYTHIRTLMSTAFSQTRMNAIRLTKFIRKVEARNACAHHFIELCLGGKDARDQRVVNVAQEFPKTVRDLEPLRDNLQIEVSSVFDRWKGIQEKIADEVAEWNELGRQAKGVVAKYQNYAKAIKVGMVALAVVGASAIVMCLLSAELVAVAAGAIVLTITAELLGIAGLPILDMLSKNATESAERFAAAATKWQDGSIAARIVADSYEPLLDYATFFADCYATCETDLVVCEKKNDIADWREKIKDPDAFSYEWICSGDKQHMEVVRDEIQASRQELKALAQATESWDESLRYPEEIVVGRATE